MKAHTQQARRHQRAKNAKVHTARTRRNAIVKFLGPNHRDLMASYRHGKASMLQATKQVPLWKRLQIGRWLGLRGRRA